MQLKIYKDYDELSEHAADAIIELVKQNPGAVLCLAAGDTPTLTYAKVAEKAVSQKVDFRHTIFIGLDEWVGIPPENEGSCQYFLYRNLFIPLKIDPKQIHLFDALSNDLAAECAKMNNTIAAKGGIDLLLAGIGMNGHIGFNEPGVSFDSYAHVINLDAKTQQVGQKYFREPMSLRQGITLGMKHFSEAKKAILIANGAGKATVIRKALKEPVTNQLPASMIQRHKNGWVMVDEEAAHQYLTST
jgi:glucosamine-6-phosphate isomerase